MSGPLWIVQAAPDGAPAQLARGTVRWDVELFETGLPVVVRAEGELRVLHEGGFWSGVSMPVPPVAPGLRAAWLARGLGARLYRTSCGFERALSARRDCSRMLRASAHAWARFEMRAGSPCGHQVVAPAVLRPHPSPEVAS